MDWIDVSRNTPTPNTTILLYHPMYGRYLGQYILTFIDNDKDWPLYQWTDPTEGNRPGGMPPTHWMPLPPPEQLEILKG